MLGAGGLGTGMNMSSYVETRYAVEFSPSAALTYQ
jgi:DNA (cytosine-5)-methyltransferase 1